MKSIMQTRNILPVLLLLSLVTPTLQAASAGGSETKKIPAPTVQPGKQSALKTGMAAGTVMDVLGKPALIRPMPTATGKAEVWIYSRQISNRVDRVAFPAPDVVTDFTTPDGMHTQTVSPGAVQFHDVHYVTEETVEVLMFNNHYVTEKTTSVERQLYE